MRVPKSSCFIRSLVISLLLAAAPSFAVDLPTIEPTETLPAGACFMFRCFPVAVALDGDTAAYSNIDPALSIYARSGGGQWQLQQILTNPDFTRPTTPQQIERSLPFPPFGLAFALSGDSLLVAGTSRKYNFKDVVYVYRRLNGVWTHIQVLALQRAAGAGSTTVTEIAMDGEVALVAGVQLGGTTAQSQVDVFVRREDGTYLRRAIIEPPTEADDGGYAVSTSNQFALIGNADAAQGNGRAYLYERAAGGWLLRKTFGPAPGLVGARFGNSVVIKGDRIAISAPSQPVGPHLFGAIHSYVRDANAWQLEQVLVAPELSASENTAATPADGWSFGTYLSFDGDRLVATTSDLLWNVPPLAYVFEHGRAGWSPVAEISDRNTTLYTRGIALSGSSLLLHSANDSNYTPIYVLELPALSVP